MCAVIATQHWVMDRLTYRAIQTAPVSCSTNRVISSSVCCAGGDGVEGSMQGTREVVGSNCGSGVNLHPSLSRWGWLAEKMISRIPHIGARAHLRTNKQTKAEHIGYMRLYTQSPQTNKNENRNKQNKATHTHTHTHTHTCLL